MYFSFSSRIALSAECVARLVDSPAAVAYLMWPLLRLDPLDGVPGERFRPGPQRFRVRLLGLLPVGVQSIDVSWPEGAAHVLLDVGGNDFTRDYAHRIEVLPAADGRGAFCRDETEIDAGALTLPVTIGFWCVNRVVQARWRRLARLVEDQEADRLAFSDAPART